MGEAPNVQIMDTVARDYISLSENLSLGKNVADFDSPSALQSRGKREDVPVISSGSAS